MDRPVLVTGARGLLGSDLVVALRQAYGEARVICTDCQELDITDRSQVSRWFQQVRPGVVVNAAAFTDVDGAETRREEASRLNALGPGNLAEACGSAGARLVHFGTDYVFDGTGHRPWAETDAPNPINHYGATKLAGDLNVLAGPRNLVLRIQWLYGRRRDRFTALRGKDRFTPFCDQFGAPTWSRRVAAVVVELLNRDAAGLFHVAHDDHASWAETYAFACRELGLAVRLVPCRSSEVNLPAPRPLFGVMSNRKLVELLGQQVMGSWKDSLREFLRSV
ncbi:MAG: dTDP-4-dehydrorhamnose reductase [Candidatus Riflebacteria bacterium]|nr:dTDP-4-dehydrorhamnose reductase [Candidatus Riflebacteria bacterium]